MADTATLDEIALELSALRDLFQRRLFDDRSRTRLYDELYAQVELARHGLVRSHLRPLLNELLLLHDRLRGIADSAVVESVIEELEEILRRRDVRRFPTIDQFDPKFHDAVRVAPVPDSPKGQIIAVLRDGYLLGEEVLRPALVVVASGPSVTAPHSSPTSEQHGE